MRHLAGILLAAVLCAACAPPPDDGLEVVDAKQLLAALSSTTAETVQLVKTGNWARSDGYAYTVDLAQLLVLAARLRHKQLYTDLRKQLISTVMIDDPSDTYTRGFVAWRYWSGEKLDASGTTEALRLARGLWEGDGLVKDADDRKTAQLIAAGYARHQWTSQDVWIIRNYFNLGTRAFATNSYLVDYDPDLLAAMAKAGGDKSLAQVAQRSHALIGQARTKVGLLHEVIQPEIVTLLPKEQIIFSPNDVVRLHNTCTVAERATSGKLGVSRGVLDFALSRHRNLSEHYFGSSGRSAAGDKATIVSWACLVRLSVRLDDDAALARFLPRLLGGLSAHARPLDPFTLSEVGSALLEAAEQRGLDTQS